ncbi:MAG TPA: PAS domain S-box protein [Prolixibacteraceae bacterium]|nr:PAS domain S-box protein [Prolixibacteraceae bacterium]
MRKIMNEEDEGNTNINDLFKCNELYQTLFENASDVIFYTRGLEVIDCNKAALLLFGLASKKEMIGRSPFDFSPERQADGTLSNEKALNLISADSRQTSQNFYWNYLKSDGTPFDANVILNSFNYGNHTFLQFSIKEITLQEKTQNNLHKCEDIQHRIIEAIPHPVFAKDENFIYTLCNQAFADYIGKTKEEIIGSSVFQISDQEKASIYLQADKDLMQNGSEQIYETKVKFNDGTDHDVVFHKSVITDRHGSPIGILGLIEDITTLRKNEKKLIETDLKYKKIFDNVQDVFYQTDLNGIITDISPSIEKYSNYFTKDIIGQPIENFYVDPDDRESLKRKIKEKGEALDFELLLKGKYNKKVWASVNAHFIFDENGRAAGIEGTIRDLTERKQVDDKLKLSLSLLQATLDSTADGILVVDRSGRITSYNNQFKAIFNLSEKILESKNDAAVLESVLIQFKNPVQFSEKVQYLYENPESESFDTLKLNDGRILERFSFPQRMDGTSKGRVWRFKDVTILKKDEQQLQLMAHTLKSINECVSIIDVEDRILFINEAFIKTYGFTEEELIGQGISMVRTDDKLPEINQKIHDVTNDSGWQGEILNRRKDGSDFPISLSTTIVRNDKDEILGIVGIAVDITESKKIENELRKSEERYRNLIETMPDGVYQSSPEGKFVEINQAMVKMLGYKNKEDLMAIDIKTKLYLDPSDRESMVLNLSSEDLDIYPLKRADSSVVWVEDHGWYVKDKKGNILFHEGILRDVTDRKMAEIQLQQYSDELKELNSTKDKFFSIIAHDLKSPFNSISGLSEILKNEVKHLDIGTIEQYSEMIHSTSQNTYRLLENLLDWARIQQSGMPFRLIPVIPQKIIVEIIGLLAEKTISKKINIVNEIPENLTIWADEDMLTSIFRNLVSNALKFTSAKGKVEIKAISRPNEIEFSVKDTGTGIKKTDIKKIFNVGSNYSRRGTANEKGTGLGLILCKEFVEKHGGKIWIESEEGKGSTFTFTINQSESLNIELQD